jgi:hypothetical protein
VFLAVLVDHAQNLEFPGIVDRGLDPQDILVIVELDRVGLEPELDPTAFGPCPAVDRDLTGEGRVRLAIEEAQDVGRPEPGIAAATRSSRTVSSTPRSLNSRSVASSHWSITHQYEPNPAF